MPTLRTIDVGGMSGTSVATYDRWRSWRSPVLVGSGAQFPQGDDEVAVELTDSRSFSNGVASLTYRPAQAGVA